MPLLTTRKVRRPLLLDPTRSIVLRRQFSNDVASRFDRLRRAIWKLLVDEDAFGLKPVKHTFPTNAVANTRYAFLSTLDQVARFDGWLKAEMERDVLGGVTTLEEAEKGYWANYVNKGYEKGAGRAFDDVRKPYAAGYAAAGADVSDFYAGTRAQFLASSFARPVAVQKVKLLAGRVYSDLKGVTEQMGATIKRELTDGLVRGESPLVVGRRLNKVVDGYKNRGTAIARTECLPGETLVNGAVVRAVFRRWYDGLMVEVETRSGRKFSATPNHPMLTQDGWVGAGSLKEGDKLIRDNREQDSGSSGDEDVVGRPTTLSEIFDSLSAVGIGERVPTGKPDFHGDGMDGQVDILRPDGELRIGSFAPLDEPDLENVLTPAGKTASRFCPACGGLLPVDQRVCFRCGSKWDPLLQEAVLDYAAIYPKISSDLADGFAEEVAACDFSRVNVGAVLVADPPLSPRVELCSRVGATDSSLSQDFTDLLLLGANSGGKLPLSEARQVELDDVVSVRIRPFSGHVYNLQTDCGYFTIDSLYTGNTIRAHAEGQLDAMEELGVEEVGVMVEWSSAYDERTCPVCADLDGVVMPIREAHGSIPVHPNCRCCYIPSTPGRRGEEGVRVGRELTEEGKVITTKITPHVVPSGQDAIGKSLLRVSRIKRTARAAAKKKNPSADWQRSTNR